MKSRIMQLILIISVCVLFTMTAPLAAKKLLVVATLPDYAWAAREIGGEYIEVQGTAEESTFSEDELAGMLKMANLGIKRLIKEQKKVLRWT